MPQLYMITVPGLQVKSDWAAVHDRLLADFPGVTDVLATTMKATLLIVYEGRADIDAWLAGVNDGILSRRLSAARGARRNAADSTPRPRAEVHGPALGRIRRRQRPTELRLLERRPSHRG
jgi:hypothetical protein